ncbi:hypothetical protein [Ornithinimicrobium sp. INDO-MA30-4]|uniref:hypothetical protein n=1 Tax=Ornithinimicrobium sp. INDO-MA30-4 TaxID=2908651 RepID=UPI001F26A07A|nr:hypothetical protein [Ornithinimicrobium sp. INDO-MA30-4]UJH71471.1 hypothetical protein L0A91_07205 [Ornithinimicrobium sp. INDO-MA30-4]
MPETGTWISILPPVIAIVLVITTKKVLPSLGAGVLSAALIVGGYNPIEMVKLTWEAFAAIFGWTVPLMVSMSPS